MKRRDFLRSVGAATLAVPLMADGWRTFEVTTHVEVLKPAGETLIWLPAVMSVSVPFQRLLSNQVKANGGQASIVQNHATDNVAIVGATYPAGAKAILTLTSRVATQNYSVNLSAPAHSKNPTRSELEHFLRPTRLLPTDGIVKAKATEITSGARTDLAKARAIYDWIVDNTFRDPKTRGCGRGDIRFMLESKDLSGKCADLNSLFVGLARASGLPARDVFGIRTAKSQLGFKSLGTSSENVTKAQHCRAEVYISEFGWIPVDPADVRKVVLEEPPANRRLDEQMVKEARKRLFGSWEMNWIAYNFAHDVALPGSKGAPVGFLMYPQAETGDGRLDSLDPASFRYEITSREITAVA